MIDELAKELINKYVKIGQEKGNNIMTQCCVCKDVKVGGTYVDLTKQPKEIQEFYTDNFVYSHGYCPECKDEALVDLENYIKTEYIK